MEYGLILKNILLIAPIFGLSASNLGEPRQEEKNFGPVNNWPKFTNFGQISGVSVDNSENVYVFHRGDRQWDSTTFSVKNIFVDKDKGPIRNETIVVLDHNGGSLIKKTGANMFYLPHGLTVDGDNNLWLTDVALHQVFKFPPLNLTSISNNLGKPSLSLGVPLEPGSDKQHFCKPTGVGVDMKTKEFYVSDGYCNSRIMKFDESGNFLLSVGRSTKGFPHPDYYMFQVPHALAVAEDKETLFVADRENFRVLSYFLESGKFKKSYAEELKSRVFSVAYSPLEGGFLFVLTSDNIVPKTVAVYDVESAKLILSFSPKTNFTNPHDLAVSPDGKYCYVVELNPYRVWKFKIDMGTISRFKHQEFSGLETISEKPNGEIQEPVPAESKVDKANDLEGTNSFLAGSLVVSVVIISFLVFMFHCYKRKGGYRRYETARLILDDDEGGIRLT